MLAILPPPETGGVPALRFAQRLILLPTGVIGVALSTAILPILARCLERGGEEKHKEVGEALYFATFLTLPAAMGFFFSRRRHYYSTFLRWKLG